MARLPRLKLPGVPQHVVQRGNNRQVCFFSDEDYTVYLDKLKHYSRKYNVDTLYQALGNTDKSRQQAYRTLFEDEVSDLTLAEIRNAINKAWVWGDSRFKKQIEKQTGRSVSPKPKGGDRKSEKYQACKHEESVTLALLMRLVADGVFTGRSILTR